MAPTLRCSRSELFWQYAFREPRLGLGIIFFLLGLLSGLLLPTLAWQNYSLASRGLPALATVTIRLDGAPTETLRFKYAAGGKEYFGSVAAEAELEHAEIGDSIRIVYLPDNPQVYCVGTPFWQQDFFMVLLLGLPFSAAGIYMIGKYVGLIRSRVQLRGRGRTRVGHR